jgi:hypothetical protein
MSSTIREALYQIVYRSRYLSELFGQVTLHNDRQSIVYEALDDKLLSRWCEVVCQGNWDKFSERLRREGLDIESVHVLSGQYIQNDSNLPTWALVLEEIIYTSRRCLSLLKTKADRRFDRSFHLYDVENEKGALPTHKKQLPFEDILFPVILVARKRLLIELNCSSINSDNAPLALLSEEAYFKLEHHLLEKIVSLSEKIIYLEFINFIPFCANCSTNLL